MLLIDSWIDTGWLSKKIPHRTMYNISAIRGLICKILEAVYSRHFSGSNGIQCIHCTLIIQPHYCVKQLLMKLQFFRGELFGTPE